MPAISLAAKTLYLNKNIDYIKDISITEYDIKSAGFSVIKYKKLLSEEIIQSLEKMEKKQRNIRIGKYMRTIEGLAKEVNNTLAEVRRQFVILNSIEEEDILSIKKDAIFIIKKKPTNLIIYGYFEFRPKSSFTSYMFIGNKEFYYSGLNKEFLIKGLSEEREGYHGEEIENIVYENEPLLMDIKRFMALGEKLSQDALYEQFKRYKYKYTHFQLNKKTYRNIVTGYYDIGEKFHIKNISDDMLKQVNISYNWMTFIQPIISYML